MEMRFCPQCGHRLEKREQAGRMREICPACGFIFYHNPVPGVAVIVAGEDGIVLVRRRYPPRAGGWCFPAGFVEAGESSEETAVREIREETGLDVQVDDLVGVYSFDDEPQGGVVIFYTATAVGGEMRAGDDAAEVRIFTLEEMPRLAFRTHREALERWKRDRQRRQTDFPETEMHIEPLPGLRIRRALPGDEDDVLRLLRLIPTEASIEGERLRAAAQRFREAPTLEVLVAEVEGDVVGFLSLSFPSGLTGVCALINDLAVESTHRRRGIGASLVEAAVRLARRRGSTRLLVDTSRASELARVFYRACGFPTGGIAPLRID
jgi:ADP-ribose pyrophosphatase YjhB (NUDIX family)/GNAT superfamily N-acetyltransferase